MANLFEGEFMRDPGHFSCASTRGSQRVLSAARNDLEKLYTYMYIQEYIYIYIGTINNSMCVSYRIHGLSGIG